MEKLILIGLVVVLIGIIIMIIGSISLVLSGGNSGKTNVAVGGFIGPIPFGFFTSKKMFWIWLLMLVIIIVFWFLMRRIL